VSNHSAIVDSRWDEIDKFADGLFVGQDEVLTDVLNNCREAGLPDIAVTAVQGAFLKIIAQSIGAKRILEIGTLGGYSTIWLARALPPNGKIVTLEIDSHHAEVARENFVRAELTDPIELREGPAQNIMRSLIDENCEPFDLVFIDADKKSCPAYFQLSLELTHPHSLIITDNAISRGRILDTDNHDEKVEGLRRFLKMLAEEPRVEATLMQTVGSKGYDGFSIAYVKIPKQTKSR
jgi:predicted O-methyltransferase YrrM